jgi:hypothetical protein
LNESANRRPRHAKDVDERIRRSQMHQVGEAIQIGNGLDLRNVVTWQFSRLPRHNPPETLDDPLGKVATTTAGRDERRNTLGYDQARSDCPKKLTRKFWAAYRRDDVMVVSKLYLEGEIALPGLE